MENPKCKTKRTKQLSQNYAAQQQEFNTSGNFQKPWRFRGKNGHNSWKYGCKLPELDAKYENNHEGTKKKN